MFKLLSDFNVIYAFVDVLIIENQARRQLFDLL